MSLSSCDNTSSKLNSEEEAAANKEQINQLQAELDSTIERLKSVQDSSPKLPTSDLGKTRAEIRKIEALISEADAEIAELESTANKFQEKINTHQSAFPSPN